MSDAGSIRMSPAAILCGYVVYHNAVMDEDWKILQELEAQYSDPSERKGRVEEQYRGTYWYYYEYE